MDFHPPFHTKALHSEGQTRVNKSLIYNLYN